MEAAWDDVGVAVHVSAYSLKALVDAFVPLMGRGRRRSSASTSTPRVAWPAYDWMGVAKAALESTSRYLARELGSRGHPGQPGGRRSHADDGRQVDPRLLGVRGRLARRAPARLGHQRHRRRSPRACVALLSDWFPATTGEMVHVDGGYHAIGA